MFTFDGSCLDEPNNAVVEVGNEKHDFGLWDGWKARLMVMSQMSLPNYDRSSRDFR